ncbi:NTP transferase domain-containing protein [Patescibacteria group bacterium]|nr:NTP transferase domain-containing protein [Patescibacteria group bacterium]MBU1890128.1 NTP transferase domain-containing protein [Patescibacteria group bacterium]
MKGIILAGGQATRLQPLTLVTNKHLLPVYDKPMIYYPLQTLVDAGIKDIMVISGKGHAGHFLELLRSGSDFGVRLSYGVQEEAGGIAQALALCEDFADRDSVAVILGDNIFENNVAETAVKDFEKQKKGAKIFLKEVHDPERFGVAEISGEKILGIEEKPKKPKSLLAVVGLYMYDEQVWDVVKTLKPSGRGELEITDVNNYYIDQGTMTYEVLDGQWTDAGTFESLYRANKIIAEKKGSKK